VHDGMQYDPIQGQGLKVKVTSPWKLEVLSFSSDISSVIHNGS